MIIIANWVVSVYESCDEKKGATAYVCMPELF